MSQDPSAAQARGLGLYVHFPYCTKRCIYCDFTLATPRRIPATAYTDALLLELERRLVPADVAHRDATGGPTEQAAELDPTRELRVARGTPLRSLYVGGGTPSLWPRAELGRFLGALGRSLPLERGAEVTLEVNPEELVHAGPPLLDELVALGVNRVSLGLQSLDDRSLALMTRAHGRSGALGALELVARAHEAGRLTSYSVDLMYGLPGQTSAAWADTLDEVLGRAAPPHLSLYSLTVEPRTVLASRIRKREIEGPDDAIQAEMMFLAREILHDRGYTHYEVSSWAKPGHLAIHNSAYWELRPYLALGAGAHGFLSGIRYQNEGRPSRYIEQLLRGEPIERVVERPDPTTLAFERLMTGLRRLDIGVLLTESDLSRWATPLTRELARGRLERVGDRVRLTGEGLRTMDELLLEFLA